MKWLVGIDGSTASQKAITRVSKLARDGDEVNMYHCYVSPSAALSLQTDQQARRELITQDLSKLDSYADEQAKVITKESIASYAELKGKGKVKSVIERSVDCKASIVGWSDRNKIDTIVMGSRQLTQMERMIVGSVSRYVVLNSQTSAVLVVK